MSNKITAEEAAKTLVEEMKRIVIRDDEKTIISADGTAAKFHCPGYLNYGFAADISAGIKGDDVYMICDQKAANGFAASRKEVTLGLSQRARFDQNDAFEFLLGNLGLYV